MGEPIWWRPSWGHLARLDLRKRRKPFVSHFFHETTLPFPDMAYSLCLLPWRICLSQDSAPRIKSSPFTEALHCQGSIHLPGLFPTSYVHISKRKTGYSPSVLLPRLLRIPPICSPPPHAMCLSALAVLFILTDNACFSISVFLSYLFFKARLEYISMEPSLSPRLN